MLSLVILELRQYFDIGKCIAEDWESSGSFHEKEGTRCNQLVYKVVE